ncbi:hypothetical protein MMC14_003043 [Varicellaria rhodocarpa]|nr:hypothetical protein [Varicellaria rhodocarpa]
MFDSDYVLTLFATQPLFRALINCLLTVQVKPNFSTEVPRDHQTVLFLGNRAVGARKITADLDSDDTTIYRMKLEGHKDKAIVDFLKGHGRVIYNHKTISSRFRRINIVKAAELEKELDRGLKEWHAVDVCISHRILCIQAAKRQKDKGLLQAVEAAKRVVQRMKQEADNKYWLIVAKTLKSLQPTSHYSKNACEARFTALANHTAVLPPELEDDPDIRAVTSATAETRKDSQPVMQMDKIHGISHGKEVAASPQISYSDRDLPQYPPTGLSNGRPSKLKRRLPSSFKDNNLELSGRGTRDDGNASQVTSLSPKSSSFHTQPRGSKTQNPMAALSSRARAAIDEEISRTNPPKTEDVDEMSCNELRKELSSLGVSSGGLKEALRAKLRAARARETSRPPSKK